jgi:hypothetical protein
MMHGVMRTVVGGFTFGDPVMIATDFEELAAVEVTDSLAWVTAMAKRVGQEEDLKRLTRVMACSVPAYATGNGLGLRPTCKRSPADRSLLHL